MSRTHLPTFPARPATAGFLPLMLVLFVGSGCAALIYEIVWFQVLQLVMGSSAVSLAVLLGTFMGGMCAGSLLLARYVSPVRHPLGVYARLEGLIGVCGAALIVLVPLVSRLYTAVDGGGQASVALRAIVCVLLLLPPTVLMGATLPAMSRYVQDTPRGVSWLGFLYGGNIVGAVVGCVIAGFYLLRKFDLTTAALVAVAINLIVAALGFALSRRAPYTASASATARSLNRGRSHQDTPRGVYAAIALSGLTALGAEVVWTRLLSLMFGATTYAFSIILAVFLTGLAIGSGIGSWLARCEAVPRHDMVLVERLDDKPDNKRIDVDAWQTRIAQPDYAPVKISLAEVGFGSAFDVLRTYSGRSMDLAPWLHGAEINRDSNLRLQYLAGLGYNEFLGTEIRNKILTYRTFPADLFTGSPESIAYLSELVMGR